MKTRKMKKILTLLLCVGLLVQVPCKESALAVYAAETYNASAAISYATTNWSTTGELCAGFVSYCLEAGGLTSFPYCVTANVCENGNLTSYGFEKNTLVYTGTGSIKSTGTNAGKVAEGDIIVYRCYNGCLTYQHVAIVTKISGDVVYITDANGASKGQNTTYVNAGWYIDIGGHGYGQGNLTIECYHYIGNTGNYPVACVDSVTSTGSIVTIGGWAYDPDCPSASLSIHAYVGGPAGSGEGAYGGTANLTSTDVNSVYNISGNHRFSYSFTTSKTGSQQVYIYAINIDSSGNGGYDSKPIVEGGTAVNITVYPLTSIALNKSSTTLTEGDSETLSVTYTPTNTTDSKIVTWSSNDSSVATVSGGKVTAVNAGTATITAKVGSKTATCSVTVNAASKPLTGISLNKSSMALPEEGTEQLTVTYTPSDTTDSKTVTWTSSNSAIASVDNGGIVRGVKTGTTRITAAVGNYIASCDVTVTASTTNPISKQLTAISLNKTSATLTEGDTETLSVSFDPADTTDDKTITWETADESIATVNGGMITAVGAGTTTVTAKVGNFTAICNVTVNAKTTPNKPISAITLNKTSVALAEGDTEALSVSFDPADTTDDKTITWSTADATVVTVDGGTITAVSVGTATITAKVGDFTATCNVTVNTISKPLTSISLDKTSVMVTEGDTETIYVVYNPSDTTYDKTTTWTTGNSAVATVNGGTITAVGAGTTTIIAKVGNFTATCQVTVNAKTTDPTDPADPGSTTKPLTAISLDKTSVTLTEGNTDTLSVMLTPSDTTDDTTVSWLTDDSSIATVNDGTVTALGAGTTTITAKVGSFTVTCQVTINTNSGSGNGNNEPENGGKEPDNSNKAPENNTNVNGPESAVQTAQPAHIHNYSWKSVTTGTVYQDGISVLQCDCGAVMEQSTVATYHTFAYKIYDVVDQATEGENITFDAGWNWTFTDRFIEKLNERKDVSLEITFEYKWKKYRMIIPAGADYTEFLTDEDFFYGFFCFAQQTEAEIEEIVK